MPSELYTADGVGGARDGPLAAAARLYFRSLLAVFLLVSAVAAAVAGTVDLAAAVPASVSPSAVPNSAASGSDGLTLLSRTNLRLVLEVGALSGAVATGLVLVASVARDPRVSLSHGRRHAAFAALAFVAAAACGRFSLPAVVDAVGPFAAASGPALDASWFAEVWLFFPVALGFAAAAPFLLVGVVRAGVVGRFISTRQRGYVALAVVTYAACFSPPDGVTFAAFAAPPLAGFAAGLAWLEFR